MRKKILSCITVFIMLFGLIVIPANAFSARTTTPSGDYWYNGSYNPYYSAGYSGECTWYVWGRAYEITGTRPSYYPGWGGVIWSNCQSAGYSCGSTPRVGSIMCTSGHVAIVESISGDSMLISEYNWSITHGFSTATLSVSGSSAGNYRSGQQIYGYVYLGSFDDTTSPTISNVRVTDKTKDGYTVRCHVEDDVGVDRVMFPTWYDGKTGSDANWLTGTNDGSGEFSCRINVSDFGLTEGTYTTHIYAYDTSNNYTTAGVNTYIDATAPTLSDVKVYRTTTGYTVKCKVSDNYGIDRVQFPTWTEENGQDDILSDWYSNSAASGSIDGDNVSFEVKISDHNNETGKYITHIYAFDTCDNRDIYCFDIDVTFNDEKPTIEDVKITDIDETGYTVSCKVSASNGINRVQFPTWTSANGQDDLQDDWVYNATASGTIADDGTVTYRVNSSDHNNEGGLYNIHIYAYDELGNYTVKAKTCLMNSDGYTDIAEGTYNGSKYIVFSHENNIYYNDMRQYCEFIGGHLATITSQTENAFVADLINQSRSGRCFIGATDKDEEGTWKWVNGEEWSYDNWSNGQPDNSTGEDDAGEDYAEMFSNGYWNDVTSNYDSAFVCEIEGYPVFEVTNNGTSADITNNGEERTVTVTVADCDSDGVLQKITASDITFAAGEKRTFMLGSGTHKVFVWDSLEGMKPLAEVE